MKKQDYYTILGIEKGASTDEIKKAYRRLASVHHPDKIPGPDGSAEKRAAEERFKTIKEAYEHLSDVEKRYVFDRDSYTTSSKNHRHAWEDAMDDYSDLFKPVFRDNYPGHEYMWNSDSFEELSKKSSARSRTSAKSTPDRVIHVTLAEAYLGKAVQIDSQTSINIPKGSRNGVKFYNNGTMFKLEVQPHYKFKRTDDDLLVEVSISAIEAILGTVATLTHLDNVQLQFTIPAGIQSGQVVKLGGRGMQNPESSKVGDVLVRITVTVPKNMSAADISLLQQVDHRATINI